MKETMTRALPLLCVACAALVAACGRDIRLDAKELPPSTPVAAGVQPAPAADAGAQTLSTVLYSEREAEMRARSDGVMAEVTAELGDAVRAGQVLARLRDERESALVASARAAAELARAQHERAVQLHARDLLTQADLDEAIYRLNAAEATLKDAEAQLEYTRIRAPFDGLVSHRFVRAGQAVKEGDAVIRVTAPRPLRAQLLVPELQASRLAAGDRVVLHGLDGSTGTAAVARVAPVVDPASGTVELLLDVRDAGRLRPGASVTVELPRAPKGSTRR